MILLSVNFSSCFLHEMKYQETGQAVKIFIHCFGLVLVWKIILSVSAALLSLFSIFLHTPGWLWMALNCSLIRENKWWFHNFIDLSWDHGRDDSGFWKLYQSLKICFGKQVRNIIASLLTRMNITAVSSRCHKLYGYIRDLTREHLCS